MSSDYCNQDIAGWHYYKLPVARSRDGSPSIGGIFTHAKVPVDNYGHYLAADDMRKVSPGQRLQARDLTSPYGALTYAIGSGDDFTCFDFAEVQGVMCNADDTEEGDTVALGLVALHAVWNSETGGTIERAGYEVASHADAVSVAENMADRALECLCCAPCVRHDMRGWDQDGTFFVRQVARHVGWENVGRRSTLSRRILPASERSRWGNRVNRCPPSCSPAVRDMEMEQSLADWAHAEAHPER